MKRQTHLAAARVHGRRAAFEMRRAAADAALYWVLGHKDRIAKFRRAVKGTRGERTFNTLLDAIREEATSLRRRAAPKRKLHRSRRRRTAKFAIGRATFF